MTSSGPPVSTASASNDGSISTGIGEAHVQQQEEKAPEEASPAAPTPETPDLGQSSSQDTLADSTDQLPQTVTVFAESSEEFHPTDGGCHAWLVCFTSFCTNGTLFCIINSFGIIGQWLIDNNGASKSIAGAISSATIGSVFLFSALAGVAIDRAGIRPCALAGGCLCTLSMLVSSFFSARVAPLLVTHSLLFGLGSALVYTPSLVILGHHYERHLGMANGVVSLGSGVFSVALTRTLKPCLLDNIGLANTFRVLSCLTVLLLLYATAWRPMRSDRHSELDRYLAPDRRASLVDGVCSAARFLAKFFNVSIWRSRGFVVWTVACSVALFGYFVPFAFLPNFMHDRALAQLNLASAASSNQSSEELQLMQEQDSAKASSQADSSVLLICINVASGASKLAVGKLADYKCLSRLRMQQAALCLFGVCIMLYPAFGSMAALIVVSLLLGICDGAYVCLIGPIAFDLVGPSGASQGIGFMLMASAVSIISGPLVAGYISDVTGRWDISFYTCGLAPIVGSGIMFFIPHTAQTYPAVNMAEDLDQMVKSNLDTKSYKEGQVQDGNGWQRTSTSGLSFQARSSGRTNASDRRSLALVPDLMMEPSAAGEEAATEMVTNG